MSIVLEHVTKDFGKKVAVRDVSLRFERGNIYALAGENGAGKSTLAKILSKRILPSSGACLFTENETLCIVEQKPVVAMSLTVRQNVLLGVKETKENKAKFEELLKTWRPLLPVNAYAKNVGADDCFYTSLFNCMLRNPDFLVLDEPTAYLEEAQRKSLFCSLENLRKKNTGIIIITHSKNEIIDFCDTIFLLKKGTLEKSFADVRSKTETEKKEILRQIETSVACSTPVLKNKNSAGIHSAESVKKDFSICYKNICCRPKDKPLISSICFEIASGTITVIQGLSEAGLYTLEDCITGMNLSPLRGSIVFSKSGACISKTKITPRFLRRRLEQKIGLKIGIVPGDRTMRGSNPELTVSQILYSASGAVPHKNLNGRVLEIIARAEIDALPGDKASSLSGGMLQRLILERELYFEPDVLILTDVFAGLDMERTKNLSERILKFREDGKGIVILSPEHVMEDCADRLYRLEGGEFR